jgi:hypothetical protein
MIVTGLRDESQDGPEARCARCGHRVDRLGPVVSKYPISCPCSCHTWTPLGFPTVDHEVSALRAAANALSELVEAAVPDRLDDPQRYTRVKLTAALIERAISMISGETTLPEDQLQQEYPPYVQHLMPPDIDPDDLPGGNDGLP